jgi:hypothetical protein
MAKRAWCGRWVDRKGEIPEGKKPYFRLPIMNYYKVRLQQFAMLHVAMSDCKYFHVRLV